MSRVERAYWNYDTKKLATAKLRTVADDKAPKNPIDSTLYQMLIEARI